VTASIFPLHDIARRLAGDRLDVVLLLPPGRSEHSFDLTPREMSHVAKSRLGISVGLGMDDWLEKVLRGAAGADVPIVQLAPRVGPRRMTAEEIGAEEHGEPKRPGEKEHGHEAHEHEKRGHEAHEHEKHDHEAHEHEKHGHEAHGHAHGAADPHFWLDPVRMKAAAGAMVEAFEKLDPEGAEGYRARQRTVDADLDRLHAALEARARAWTNRTIITFHGSMGYFAERYGLTIAAVIEPFPGREPTARYLQQVLAVIDRKKPAALFSEPQLDRRPAQVIADQAKLPLYELDPVGGGPGAETYEALLLRNADVLDKALR
jgi:zinc transport system substrate-binding protein